MSNPAPSAGTVEELLATVGAIGGSAHPSRIDLWVPAALTLRGQPVRADVAVAIIVDALLALGYMPDGFTPGPGGRRYHYAFAEGFARS
jgi:hypothetical protein